MVQLAYDVRAGRTAPARILVNELISRTARNIENLNGKYDSAVWLLRRSRDSTSASETSSIRG
jgi:hypothetical protein